VNKELLSLKKIFWNDGGDTIRFLSNYDSILIDKFEVLKIAQSVGLKIPETIVTNEKEVLATFIKRHGEVISKAAYENLSFQYYRTAYMQYVDSFSKQDLAKIPNNFFPSVFQQKIETEVSIRAFFLDGEIYSTAIINADNKLVDYRADFENRRTVPIKLPQNIEDNIKILMKKLSINIGGIDLLKQKEGFYFLEVNPNGYFGGNSQICNYHLPKKIAQFLTKNQ
jgi:glutathione synthase/RimK-type ligase-like ATP-grasp enzyme